MVVSDHFSATDIFLDADVKNKKSLLELIAGEVARRLGRPEEEILDVLKAREDLGSTALGKGVALPHAKLSDIETPVKLFLRLERPIDFEARDGEPIDLVFVVLWPAAAPKGLLEAISGIARNLRDAGFLRSLRQAATPEEVVELLRTCATTTEEQDAAPRET